MNHNLGLHLSLHFWIKYIHRAALNILSRSKWGKTGKKKHVVHLKIEKAVVTGGGAAARVGP